MAGVSVGLAGDGDEIAAVEAVEREFDVWLDKNDAAGWGTAGDLYASLIKALPVEARADQHNWRRFAAALCWETGVDPDLIGHDSPLLV